MRCANRAQVWHKHCKTERTKPAKKHRGTYLTGFEGYK